MDSKRRLVAGMRPSGRLHLGHYQGLLRDWARQQHEYQCFFGILDWQRLITHQDAGGLLSAAVQDLAIDWLAAGISPSSATLFVQSQVPEQAELHLLLSMICPLSWLERLPNRREARDLSEHNALTLGFQQYPLLQTAHLLLFRAGQVPVRAEQLPQLQLARDLAHRFNRLFGQETDFAARAEAAVARLSKKQAQRYLELRRSYQERGDQEARERGRALVQAQQGLTLSDQERLLGYLDGSGKTLLPCPEPLLSMSPSLSGLDGQRMSRLHGNALYLRDSPEVIEDKIRHMPTDPARVRLSDSGNPERCPVWALHRSFSTEELCQWVNEGCQTAAIGCLECKAALAQTLQQHLEPVWQRAQDYEQNLDLVQNILREGAQRARAEARDTLTELKQVMGFEL